MVTEETKPLYFVVPKSVIHGNKIVFPLATVSEELISTGNLDPEKYYQIIEILPEFPNNKGYVVGDRFTGIGADIEGKGVVSEVIGAFPLLQNTFDCSCVLATVDSGKKIVNIRITKGFIRRVKKLAQSDLETKEQVMTIAKLQSAYIGKERQDVFDRFPETIGQTEVEPGIFKDKLTKHKWSFE